MRSALPALPCVLLVAGFFLAGPAHAQKNKCTDEKGRVTYQDLPCRSVEPPPPPPPPPPCTLDPKQLKDAIRRETQFLSRYADEASHRRAQRADLEPVVARIAVSHRRFHELAAQRVPLDKELEFYRNKPVPAWLKSKLDANDAQFAALAEILRGQERQVVEIQARYHCERETYGMLWAGAAPGSSACNRPACAPP